MFHMKTCRVGVYYVGSLVCVYASEFLVCCYFKLFVWKQFVFCIRLPAATLIPTGMHNTAHKSGLWRLFIYYFIAVGANRTTTPNVFYSLMKRISEPQKVRKSQEKRKKENNWKQLEDGSRPTFVPSLISEKEHDTSEKFSSNFNNLFASFRSNLHEYACVCCYCVCKKDWNLETALRPYTHTLSQRLHMH